MRMRKKKHLKERLADCADLIISDIMRYNGDIQSVFQNSNPLHMEIGCGKGAFILETAKRHPDINFIAVEKNYNVLILAAEKIKDAGLSNVKFIAGDANLLRAFETRTKCDIIYINFCDPWHKNSYRRRRLTHAQHLMLWEKLLHENGEIHFKTDNKNLFEFSLNSFSEYDMKLKNITFDLHNSAYKDENVMTEYERLFSAQGQPIYRCEAAFRQKAE
ncbi:MAG: tRNA (guanosine(46)-N7)-methyltransferase TrmB [Ruminococcaceae bacterium]|nr:tRNA (guanosine(46)-N7)-methyltransferase TrmB [Oscillospiraceae bacterium]